MYSSDKSDARLSVRVAALSQEDEGSTSAFTKFRVWKLKFMPSSPGEQQGLTCTAGIARGLLDMDIHAIPSNRIV